LDRSKTYARKVREALVTLALESGLTKTRLLEIYLNAIEWGPGIFGLGQASRYYFDKDPRLLSLKEAAFLATIIPNPVRYHGYFVKGALSPAWEERVSTLLQKMRNEGVISEEQWADASNVPVSFRPRPWRM
jgi:membrane peptidoglycan carboxypeptidase